MIRDPRALANQEFDVLVMGGGIFGAGVARDAALRGLRVALVEQADFASGTSSRSSKLIHGGFRYLEQRAWRLVRESCRERSILMETAPHLVHRTPFLLPVYEGDSHALLTLRLGMSVYDWMSPGSLLPRHQILSAARARMKEPGLRGGELRGAVRYFDCQTDDGRLCLDVILHAADHGAVCANYCRVEKLDTHDDGVAAARVRDERNDVSFDVRARVFVNAAGPWVEQVAGLTPFNTSAIRLQPTKGTHILLPRLAQEHAITFQAKRDGRIMFVLPWEDCSLVGTTDTDFSGDPGNVGADPSDIEYLLTEVNQLFPDARLEASDIITSFAGVRPLLKSGALSPSARSREQVIARQGRNLFSLAGGKYTTYRAIAEDAVDQVCRVLGAKRRCTTATTAIPSRIREQASHRLAEHPTVCATDVRHACVEEMAVALSDVMRHRTHLAISRHGGPDTAAEVAKVMADALHWNEAEMGRQFACYLAEWKRGQP